ncbi:hypothetical protein FPZ24_00630 [Sphingomonas panacisoli]|uniref:Uncharacterized protein n=1 Tax=Sphingomonas panacisoli TaxID=1813879 RepID=A0A5B8LDJ0_9SPHN|nr:hypothetical protein [Sphingomonas panacisoli]QDZ06157.1 hypothetical protein FPZ24_00630 [Sphingomonas panacisoli]
MSTERPDAGLVTEPSPHELRDPEMRLELRRAGIWLGLAAVTWWGGLRGGRAGTSLHPARDK